MRLAPIRMLRASAALLLPLVLALHACDDRAETTASPEASPPQPSAVAAESHVQFAQLRQVTARFHNFDAAMEAGYEAQVTPCWTTSSAGAMGYHYGDLDLFDANVDLLAPEVLMYEPQAGGHMRLVGMEYIVPLAAWEAAGHDLATQRRARRYASAIVHGAVADGLLSDLTTNSRLSEVRNGELSDLPTLVALAFARLPTRCRLICGLHLIHGVRLKQVAGALGVSEYG